MKKFLLIAALVLALMTSLIAGTMAQYTQEVETIEAELTNKEFSITADKTFGSFDETVDIAPGETVTYRVKVNNASEVRSDVVVKAALSQSFTGMTVTTTPTTVASTGNQAISAEGGEAKTRVAIGGHQEYLITVAWDYETGSADDEGVASTLSIDVGGTQVEE
jgi:uncharacterized repeat protein (TIGR01451 family)